MRKSFYLLVFLFFVSYKSVGQSYTWKNVKIMAGGFVTGVIHSKAQANLVYARTDVGGAYRWNQATSSWIPLTDFLGRNESNYSGVVSLAADPLNADKVYLATGLYTQSWGGTGAVLASSDQGNTWTINPLTIKLGGNEDGRSAGERLQVDPNLGSILFLGSSTDGLWKSTNSGVTWAKVNSFPVATSPIASGGIAFVHLVKSSTTVGNATPTIYVGVLRTGATNLYRSTDGGTTWAAVPGQSTALMPHHMAEASNGNMYITYSNAPGPGGINSGQIFRYTPTGNVWTNITPPLCPTGQNGFGGISVSATDPNFVVASSIDCWWPREQIYRSTNGGTSWTEISASSTWDHSPAPYASGSTPHWVGDIDIDPFNQNNVWFITGYGLWNTTNISAGAVNWVFINDGLEETVPLGLMSPPSGPPLVSIIGDIDGFRHDNVDISPPAGRLSPLYGTNISGDFAETLPTYMVRTFNNGAGNYGAYSTNAGTSWTAFGTAPGGTNSGGYISVAANGSRIVWSPGNATTAYSTNNGNTWTNASGLPNGLKPIADRVNSNKFYALDAVNGRVYVSTNGGVNFTAAATVPTVFSWQTGDANLKAVFGVEGDIWMTHPANGLYRSTNSGANFSQIAGIQQAYQVGFGKAAPAQTYPAVYIHGMVGGVIGFYRSVNAGATWVKINDNLNNFGWINAIIGDPRIYGRVYIATGGRGIIYGDDGAALPLELLDFDGHYDNDHHVKLTWTVAKEHDVKAHHIERKFPADHEWKRVASIPALNTNTSEATTYHYVDQEVEQKTSTIYYKLVSEDIDGTFNKSKIIVLNSGYDHNWVNIYPNPSKGLFNIVSQDDPENIHIKVFTIRGELVLEKDLSEKSFSIEALSGLYFIECRVGAKVKVFKVIKE